LRTYHLLGRRIPARPGATPRLIAAGKDCSEIIFREFDLSKPRS
jgi:hypothetical protein